MRTAFGSLLVGAVGLLCGGCMSGPLLDNPTRVAADSSECANPLYLAHGPLAYGMVFEKIHDVLIDFSFEIAYENRYDGRFETFPRIAPGFVQPWKRGNGRSADRLLATLQTYRHRVFVLVQPADDGGFFVDVKAFKELEDLERPIRATAGAAAFRSDNTLDRQYEVIDPGNVDGHWIPKGRDIYLEQEILKRLQRFDQHELRVTEVPGPQAQQ